MKKQTAFMTLGLMLLTPALAGGAGRPAAAPAAPACRTIAQIIGSDPQFSTLKAAIDEAGYMEMLGGGQGTLFAPTNAAFAKLPSDTLAGVLNEPALLDAVLTYHMVPMKLTAKQVSTQKSAKTVNGQNLSFSVNGSRVMVNNATVTRADIVACNGIIHVIDTVLVPQAPTGTAAPKPAPVATAPVVAPAPASAPVVIPALPLSGRTTTTTTTTTTTAAPVTTTTTTTTETPATTEAPATTETPATTEAPATTETPVNTDTCYDVLVNDDRFSTLRDLLSDAGLTDTLMTEEYTVFAPTNAAFEAFDQEQLVRLSNDPAALRRVLLYHVIPGRLEANAITGELKTADGATFNATASGNEVKIGETMVNTTAIKASNCNIYVVDRVLTPSDLVIVDPVTVDVNTTTTTATSTTVVTTTNTNTNATNTTVVTAAAQSIFARLSNDSRFTTLVSLIQAAGLTDTLSTGDVTIFAPTNEAFAKLPAGTIDTLKADPAKLRAILLNHVIGSRVTATALATNSDLTTAGGSTVKITPTASGFNYGTAAGLPTELGQGLGIIYVIDSVVLP